MFELRRTFTTGRGRPVDPIERVWADVALPALGWAVQTGAPPADVVETAGDIVVKLDLPGHKAEEIQIKVENDVLSVEAERKAPPVGGNGETYHRSERSFGKAVRSFTLPASVDSSRTVASYEAGVLKITLPKRDEAKPRTIQVSVK
jgi:HSP20 family protein